MKLGTQTGSVINHLYTRGAGHVPTVGMGATICHWSDRSAGTVCMVVPAKGQSADELHDGMQVHIKGDEARVISGSTYNGSAKYEYIPQPDAKPAVFILKAGQWRETYINGNGRRVMVAKGGGHGLALGRRDAYRDPSF